MNISQSHYHSQLSVAVEYAELKTTSVNSVDSSTLRDQFYTFLKIHFQGNSNSVGLRGCNTVKDLNIPCLFLPYLLFHSEINSLMGDKECPTTACLAQICMLY